MHNSGSGRSYGSGGESGFDNEGALVVDYDSFWNRAMRHRRTLLMIAAGLVIILAAVIILIVVLVVKGPGGKDDEKQVDLTVNATRGAVASENVVCSQVGVDIMQKYNGSAVDAAIASCLCLGVLNPFSAGIGGGGVALIRMANGTAIHLDFREVAPGAANKTMYYNGSASSTLGGMAVAVPGEVAGLEKLYEYGSGRVTWAQLFQPAIDLAKSTTVGPLLALRLQEYTTSVLNTPGLAAVYAPNGRVLLEGEPISNPKLAATLQIISDQGAQAYYNATGPIAPGLIADIQAAGGIITQDDLDDYYARRVIVRPVYSSWFQGYEFLTTSPPFSGGATSGLALNILERYNLLQSGMTPQAYHWLCEALAYGFSDRTALGDPDFVNLTNIIPAMFSKGHAAFLRSKLKANATFDWKYYTDLVNLTSFEAGSGTTHVSIVDPQRNSVALTSTINLVFGSYLVSQSSGILLNNEMDDFATSDKANAWGLIPSLANIIEPRKKPLSSMSPTMVLRDNSLYLVAGGSGGSRIITGVMQVVLNLLTSNTTVYGAIAKPRLHYQLMPPYVYTEPAFSSTVKTFLQNIGHNVSSTTSVGFIQVVQVNTDGTLSAASDPRKLAKAAGY